MGKGNSSLLLIAAAAAAAIFISSSKKAPPKKDEEEPDLDAGSGDWSGWSDSSSGVEGRGAGGWGGTINGESTSKVKSFNDAFANGLALVAAAHAREILPPPHGANLAKSLAPMIQRTLPIFLTLHASRKGRPTGEAFIDFPSKIQFDVSEYLKANWNTRDLGLPDDPNLQGILDGLKPVMFPKLIQDAKNIANEINRDFNMRL